MDRTENFSTIERVSWDLLDAYPDIVKDLVYQAEVLKKESEVAIAKHKFASGLAANNCPRLSIRPNNRMKYPRIVWVKVRKANKNDKRVFTTEFKSQRGFKYRSDTFGTAPKELRGVLRDIENRAASIRQQLSMWTEIYQSLNKIEKGREI